MRGRSNERGRSRAKGDAGERRSDAGEHGASTTRLIPGDATPSPTRRPPCGASGRKMNLGLNQRPNRDLELHRWPHPPMRQAMMEDLDGRMRGVSGREREKNGEVLRWKRAVSRNSYQRSVLYRRCARALPHGSGGRARLCSPSCVQRFRCRPSDQAGRLDRLLRFLRLDWLLRFLRLDRAIHPPSFGRGAVPR